jgi:protein SCO1/2
MRRAAQWVAIIAACMASALGQQGRPAILDKIGIDQKLNQQIPLDLTFLDEEGRTVPLAEYFGKRPVVLSLVYYQCPMLCNMVLNGEVRVFRAVPFQIGKEYDVVTVSFDPRETPSLAKAKKLGYIANYKRPSAATGWHFLTGDEQNIRRLADAVGFRFAWDAEHDQFAHASGIMVATPEGRLARYFYGIEYSARDLRLGLVEASQGKIGTAVDQVLLYCLHYDPKVGKYGLLIMKVIRLAGALTVVGIIALILLLNRRGSHRNPQPKAHYA